MSDELTIHDQVDAFVDGELSAVEAEAFRAHLIDCADCQRELHDIMMVAAVTQTHAQALTGTTPAPAPRPVEDKLPPVISLASRRRRVVIGAVSSLAVAAAAMVIVWRAARPEPIVLAQAMERPIEARLSDADRYRPYDVARAAGVAREEIPLDTLAKLEKRGELRGLADGYLLGGEPDRAAALLARAAESAEVESDRAAVALAQRDAVAALHHAHRALALRLDYSPALWNEALALRALDLPHGAMLAFDAIAKRGEAGWAAEAKARAAALQRQLDDLERTRNAVEAAGKDIIAHGTVPEPVVVRAYPDLIQRDLYAALAAAGHDGARLTALIPVAEALDAAKGGRVVKHVSAMVAGMKDPADSWQASVTAENEARAKLAAGDAAAAERILTEADRRCLAAHIDYRCALLEKALLEAQEKLGAVDDKLAQAALERARASGFAPKELPAELLHLIARIASARGDEAMADAYDKEWLALP